MYKDMSSQILQKYSPFFKELVYACLGINAMKFYSE